jgi:ribose transport system ATP-binding protein
LTSTESARLFDLIRQLKRDRLTIVYVSHRLEDVLLISDRITVLRDGKCVGTIAKADATPGKVIQMMVGRELKRFDRPHCARQGESRLSVKGLTGQRFRDVSFSVCPGEILGFAGLVGAGRSEVMRAIFGADRYDSGEVRMDGELVRFRSPKEAVGRGLAIVSEDRKLQSLFMELPIRLNISLVALSRLNRCGVIRRREVDRQVSLFRDRLGIRLRSLEDPVSALSGGNQQKTVLARWLAMDPRVLILDEPTHGIDVGAKAEIYGLMHRLAETGIAILLISSEMPEIIAMSDRVVVMREGRVMGVIPRESLTEDRILAYATGTRPERSAGSAVTVLP